MKIGVKYCGGCNPRYDRAELVSQLRKEFNKKHEIVSAQEGIIYDLIIILCGCTSCCAEHEKIQAKYEKIVISSEMDYIKITNTIAKYMI
ncbi:hypothetical protein OXH55_14830 [Clostridium ganghwense]|uniref:DUF1450 domain-containing protein n=1 Tax=Clostridium ganghwense TaxID=312089 RepID=A0ABT4CSA2_9CLOT|nr:hypothetical protein [Clostridium ganghwense]